MGMDDEWMQAFETGTAHTEAKVIHKSPLACEEGNSSCPQVFPTLGMA